MSWYYSFYIGKRVNDKIEIIGVYNNKGNIYPALEYSRSFASSLKDSFRRCENEELKKKLNNDLISILPYHLLPTGDYIKSGYFLIEDVQKYLEGNDSGDLFYEKLTPEVYAEKLKTESILGTPQPKKDEDGYDIKTYSCADYMYFAYPDYSCKEYDSFIIRTVVDMIEPYNLDKEDIVIVMSEG